MTTAFFALQMDRLRGLKFPPADLQTHWEGLRDLPDDALESAVGRAIRTRVDFPTPVELRQDADAEAPAARTATIEDRSRPVPPFTIDVPQAGRVVAVTREWHYYDDRCSDTGWASWWCGAEDDRGRPVGVPVQSCGRSMAHLPHGWASQCACWESNPALIAKREARRRYAEEAAQKRRTG